MKLQLFNILTFFRHNDVIDDVISPIVHRHNHMTRVHLHVQFADHIWKRFRVIAKKWQFQLNMIIEGRICRHAVMSLVMSSLWNSFSWKIYILSFYTWCQIEAILKLRNFQYWRNFGVQTNFSVISVTGSLLGYLDNQSNSLHFELLINVLA